MIHEADQFAAIDTIAYGETRMINWEQPSQIIPLFLVHWNNAPGPRTKRRKEAELRRFIQVYLDNFQVQLDTFVVHSY